MCGICGYAGMERDERLLRAMTGRLRHRGPDDDGVFMHGRVGLGMRRLSIIDVSGGAQPIFNERRSVAVVANGEIYNFRELTADLERRGHRFATHYDIETIVHLYEEHGIAGLRYLRGMFAFALYDADEDRLFLARDRLGIKPLYYWQGGGKLLFASEIKALLDSDDVSREPNPSAINDFLTLRYVPGPQTMFKGIRKLPAGHWLCTAAMPVESSVTGHPRPDPAPIAPTASITNDSPSCGGRRYACISRAMCRSGCI